MATLANDCQMVRTSMNERVSLEEAQKRAFFSPCRTWRYSLTRDVAPLTGEGRVAFIGLNPSTADEMEDDPTIRRCVDFARRWGFSQLKMLNLFAFRSTDPRGLLEVDDPIGPENDCTIAKVVGGSDLVICAWGAFPANDRIQTVLGFVSAPHCLGLTKNGAPRHPLYARATTEPQPFGDLHPIAIWRSRAVA